NVHVHRGGEEIFADALYNVGSRLGDFSGFVKVVVQRAFRIHADDFDVGILFFQKFTDAADGAAGTHAADKMSDFAFSIFPNLRAGGLVVRFGIGRIVVLIGVERVGNFAGQLFRYAVIAAGIFRFDGGGTDNHFGAQGFQQVDFLFGLLIGSREHAFVTPYRRDQRQSHAGVAGGAFDDGAAGLQQAFFFGVIDHGDANAVFHGAAGIQHLGFNPDLRFQALRHAVEPNQRRVAHSFNNVVATHPSVLCLACLAHRLRRPHAILLLSLSCDPAAFKETGQS